MSSGLIGVLVIAYVIDFLAGVFGAQKNLDNAMKVAAYAPTAAWLAGIFGLIPLSGFLSLLGLYSLYLLHTGIAALDAAAGGQGVILHDRGHRCACS